MERIYHHYKSWEDWKFGFHNNCSGEEKKTLKEEVVNLFNNESLTNELMNRVIDEWIFSCEQNLSNPSMNKIAYIGQACCCIYKNIPSTVTMEAWSLLSEDVKDRANNQAQKVLNKWLDRNKNIQLCLNIF